MFYMRKIFNDNNIKLVDVSRLIGVDIKFRLLKTKDFKIDELFKIRDFLSGKNIISKDFDVGLFLDEV